MALFDKDNPGKNLTNATLWLESSQDSDSDGHSSYSDNSGCNPFLVGALVAALLFIPGLIVSCVTYVF